MRKAFCLLAILLTSTAMAQWVYAPNPDECVNPETGQRFNPSADGRRKTAIACETVNDFQVWDGLVDWLLAFLTDEAKAQIIATVGSSGQPGAGDTSSPAAPSTWTEVLQGDAAGYTVENTSTSLTIVADSTNDLNNRTMLCQAITTDQDFQIEATIPGPSSWTGHIEDYTGFGIVFLEDRTTTASEYWQIWISNISGLSFKHDAAAPTYPWDEIYPALPISSYTIALTYDDSQDDVRAFYSEDGGTTWIEFAQRTGDSLTFGANSAACVFGTSHLSGAETTALITGAVLSGTIDAYTPGTPPAGPVWTQVPNQGLTQGTAWSLDYTAYVTCGDPPCTYSATGFPGSTGLSVSSAGVGSGTPNANDVSGSPFNVTVTATDNSTNSASEVHQFTVTASTGSTFLIPTTQGTVDCDVAQPLSAGGSAIPVPGDTIVLDGTSRGTLTIRNCDGNSTSRITVTNDTTEGGPLVITSSSTWPFQVDDSEYITIDGTGKWSGAGADSCGTSTTWPAAPTTPQCGIVVNAGSTNVQAACKFRGSSAFFTAQGMECDGNDHSGVVSFDINDHGYNQGCGENNLNGDCEWREGILVTDNYFHNSGRSGIYFGPNLADTGAGELGDLLLRNNEVSYNYVTATGCDAIKYKANLSSSGGNTRIHHNWASNTGNSPDTPGSGCTDTGIYVYESGWIDVDSNIVSSTTSNGISFRTQQLDAVNLASVDVAAWNNIVYSVGSNGISVTRQSTSNANIVATLYNNTVIDSINVQSGLSSSCAIRDNISTSGIVGNNCTLTNNNTQSVANQNFTNAASNDYTLTVSSPARNNGTASAPATDFEDESRPQEGTDDQGADEYTP